MAKNNLTPYQDLLTRDFYLEVAKDPNILPSQPQSRRQLQLACLDLLNYRMLPNGALVSKEFVNIRLPYGSNDYSEYPDEFQADYERSIDLSYGEDTYATTADIGTSDPSSSESPTGDTVGGVLQQDV